MNRSNRYFSTKPYLIRRWNGLALLVVPAERRVSHVRIGMLATVVERFPGIEVFDIRGTRLGRLGEQSGERPGPGAEDA